MLSVVCLWGVMWISWKWRQLPWFMQRSWTITRYMLLSGELIIMKRSLALNSEQFKSLKMIYRYEKKEIYKRKKLNTVRFSKLSDSNCDLNSSGVVVLNYYCLCVGWVSNFCQTTREIEVKQSKRVAHGWMVVCLYNNMKSTLAVLSSWERKETMHGCSRQHGSSVDIEKKKPHCFHTQSYAVVLGHNFTMFLFSFSDKEFAFQVLCCWNQEEQVCFHTTIFCSKFGTHFLHNPIIESLLWVQLFVEQN